MVVVKIKVYQDAELEEELDWRSGLMKVFACRLGVTPCVFHTQNREQPNDAVVKLYIQQEL